MAPRPRRSPFTAPGEPGRGWWRALAELFGFGLLTLLLGQGLQSVGPSLAIGAAAVLLFTVRRRFPATALIAMAVATSALPAAGMLMAVTAYTAAKLLVPSRRRWLALLGTTVGLPVLSTLLAPVFDIGSHSYGFALGAVLAATTVLVPGLVGTAEGQQQRLLLALGDRAAAAEEARRLAESESRMHERSRIAAEMHDLVGHRLSLISLHAGGLEMALGKESPELRDEASLVRRATGDAMRELREVLGVLGPLGRDTGVGALTDATGTRSDIEALAEESRRGGIPVELSWEGPDLDIRPAQVRRAVHRVVRESLTNVHRYAAGANVTVAVAHTDLRVVLSIRNGLPPTPPEATTGLGSGRGLTGLRERVAVLGGTLTAGPTAVGGFEVAADLPAQPDPEAALVDADAPPGGPEPGQPPVVRRLAGLQRRVVTGLTGLLGLAGIGVMMLFGLLLVDEASDGPAYYSPEEPRIGMDRETVEESVYGDDPLVRAAATGREPDRPEDATSCLYPMVSSDQVDTYWPVPGLGQAEVTPPYLHPWPGQSWGETPWIEPERYQSDEEQGSAWERGLDLDDGPGWYRITRYCFTGDTLTAIDTFTVPIVSQLSPWEAR